jgi:hypothetical protein
MDALYNRRSVKLDHRSSKPWLPFRTMVPNNLRFRSRHLLQWLCGALKMLVATRSRRKQVLFAFFLLMTGLWMLGMPTSYPLPPRTVLLNPLHNSRVALWYAKHGCGDHAQAEVIEDWEHVLNGPPTEQFRGEHYFNILV